eukprot:5546747-Alexandrium_andersonii.AAC.1
MSPRGLGSASAMTPPTRLTSSLELSEQVRTSLSLTAPRRSTVLRATGGRSPSSMSRATVATVGTTRRIASPTSVPRDGCSASSSA